MEKEVPFAPQQPSVGIVSGKKEPSTSFGILGKANSEKGLANDNFAEVRKDENKNFDQRVSQDFPARAKAKKAQRSAPASRVSPEPLAVVAASKPSSQNNLTEAEPKTKQMEGAEVPTAAQSGGSAPAPSAEAPPAALPSVSLDQSYKNVPYSQEQSVLTWTSNNAPSTVEGQELVTEGETFNQYWRALQTDQAMPVLDFTKQAVVVLIAGIKPTPGYSIHIARLEEKTDQLVVHYRVEIPSADAVLPQMITRPWSMQVIPKPSKPVVFLKDL
jgi:hypothetical protein